MAERSVPSAECRSGIYEIVNTIDEKRYIGSSKNVSRRFVNHRQDLKNRRHKNRKLAAAWNKYGAEAFVFRVIFLCRPENLIEFEQHFIDTLRPEYNLRIVAESNAGMPKSPEHRAKLSAALMGRSFNVGVPKSMEHRANLSAAKRGLPIHANRGNKSRSGMKTAPEIVARQVASLKATWARRKAAGLVRNEEAIAKRAASLRATWARKKAAAP